MAKSNGMNSSERLDVARWLQRRRRSAATGVPGLLGLKRKTSTVHSDLTNFAQTRLETAIARILSRARLEPLMREANRDRRRLLFRGYYVPTLAATLIGASRFLDKKPGTRPPPWWLIDHAVHMVAFERTFLEDQLLDGGLQSLRRTDAPASLPKPTIDWIPHDPTRISEVEGRLDEWRKWALESVRHYFSVAECRDMEGLPWEKAYGAMMGAMQRLTPWPDEVVPLLVQLLQSLGPNTLQWYFRAKGKATPNKLRKHNALDCWLIEIQPAARRYDWQAHNVLVMARLAFPRSKDCLRTVDQLRNRIRDLDLQPPEKAIMKRRPSTNEITISRRLKPEESLAVFIRSVGEMGQDWMLGSLGLTAH